MNISKHSSKKISVLMFVCSILVVLYHSADYRTFNLEEGMLNRVSMWFIDICFPLCQSLAMPVFCFFSGLLFYISIKNHNDLLPKVKKRVTTLLIPYLAWNFIWTLVAMCISKIPAVVERINNLPIFDWNYTSFVYGILLYKYNGVMWYLLYIMIFTIVSPLLYWLLKVKTRGIIIIVLCLLLTPMEKILFDMKLTIWPLLFYLLGSFMAIHYSEEFNKKYNKNNSILAILILLLFLCASCKWRPGYFYMEQLLYTLTKIIIIRLLWIATDLFVNDNCRIRWWMKCYFFIYLYHMIPQLCINKLIRMVVPNTWYGLLINRYFGSFTVIIIGLFIAKKMSDLMPNIYSILTGGRKI